MAEDLSGHVISEIASIRKSLVVENPEHGPVFVIAGEDFQGQKVAFAIPLSQVGELPGQLATAQRQFLHQSKSH